MSCPLIHVQGGSCRPLLAHAPDISITMESLWEYFMRLELIIRCRTRCLTGKASDQYLEDASLNHTDCHLFRLIIRL